MSRCNSRNPLQKETTLEWFVRNFFWHQGFQATRHEDVNNTLAARCVPRRHGFGGGQTPIDEFIKASLVIDFLVFNDWCLYVFISFMSVHDVSIIENQMVNYLLTSNIMTPIIGKKLIHDGKSSVPMMLNDAIWRWSWSPRLLIRNANRARVVSNILLVLHAALFWFMERDQASHGMDQDLHQIHGTKNADEIGNKKCSVDGGSSTSLDREWWTIDYQPSPLPSLTDVRRCMKCSYEGCLWNASLKDAKKRIISRWIHW